MPRVPQYQPNQVQEAGLPTVRNQVNYSREAFGGGQAVAQAFNAAEGMVDTYDKIKVRVNDTLSKEGDVKFSQLETDTIEKIKMMQGKDAANYKSVIESHWDKGADEIINQYQDPEVRASLKKLADVRRASIYQSGSTHMVGELDKFEQATHESFIDAHRSEAVINYRDPSRVKDSIQIQLDQIEKHGVTNGWDGDTIKHEKEKAESQTHLQVLARMINNGEDLVASKYYKDVKKMMVGDDASTADKLLEEGTLRGESQRKSDAIVGKSENMTEALEKARDINDPKLRDETVSRVKQYYSEKKQGEDQRIEDLHRRATDVIDRDGSVDAIPREDWSQFSLSERSALKSYAAKRREGTEPETEWADYYDLTTMAAYTATRDKFLKINLMTYRNKLADAEFKELVKLQKELRDGTGSKSKVLDDWRTENSIVNERLNSAGIDPTPKQGSDDSNRVAKFRSMVAEQVRRHQDQTGKPATNEDIERIADNLLVNVVTEKPVWYWPDTKKRVFELDKNDEQAAIKIDDVPRIERQKIESALRSKGIPVTEGAILELYGRKLRSMVPNE